MARSIKRKAVPRKDSSNSQPDGSIGSQPCASFEVNLLEGRALEEVREVEAPVELGKTRLDLDEQLENLQLETGNGEQTASLDDAVIAAQTVSDNGQAASKASKFKAAIGEIKHFAGGLFAHPYEATKHHSVLRHSSGFVYYNGPTTSIAITVFSDEPLPNDRTLWLQKRGFSGQAGLKVGAKLGTRSAWIDVTPSIHTTADLLPSDDEKAWQRDIAKFLKKAKDEKHVCNHRPYETNIVRIPHVAEDGYFRVVLCAGRKVLCPSPVFRYASSSLDPSILRGASLTTLPLELGIWMGSFVARNAANTAACGVMQPTIDTIQGVTKPLQLGGVTQWAATTAYDVSGTADRVDSAIESYNQDYEEKRGLALQCASGDAVETATVVGSEDGPEQPYPIQFSGKATKDADHYLKFAKVPSVKLVDVSADTLLRLSGTYMGWVIILGRKRSSHSPMPEGLPNKWQQAVITVTARIGKDMKVVQQKDVFVHTVREFGDAKLLDSKLDVMLMAYLHPVNEVPSLSTADAEQRESEMLNDIETTRLSLSRNTWAPVQILERIRTASASRSFSDRIVNARQSGQKQLDRVPVHRLGFHTDSMKLKDDLIGTGGICVKR